MLPYVLLALFAAAAPSGAVADADAGALTAAFTRALGTESIVAFEPLAAGHVEGNAWLSVKDLLARFSCFDIHSARVIRAVERDGMTEVEIDIAMTALQSSSGRERIPPQRWFLIVSTENGPRIAAAYTAERHFARRVLRAPTSREREALLEEARAMPYEVFTEIADEITDSVIGSRPSEAPFERSYALAESLLTAAITWEDAAIEARAWRELATLARMTGPFSSALAYAEAAHHAAQRSGNCDLIAAATFTLGSVLAYHMDSPQGVEIIRDAASMAESLDDPRVALRAMHNLIVTEIAQWNLVSATEWSLRLADISARIRYSEGEANAAINLAGIHGHLHDHKVSLRYRIHAYSLYLAAGNRPFAAEALADMALMQGHWDDYEASIALYTRAMMMTEDPVTRVRLKAQMAAIQQVQERIDDAECTLAEIEWNLFDGYDACSAGVVHGYVALARGRYEEAVVHGFHGMQDHIVDNAWIGAHVAATALSRLGEHEAARLMYYDTIDLVERQLARVPDSHWIRTRYLTGRTSAYRDLTELLVKLGRSREALQISERVKGRTLIESMTARRERVPAHAQEQTTIAIPIARMTELNRELLSRRARGAATGDVERDLALARHELSRLETEAAMLVRRNEALADRLTLTDALAAIRPETAAIEFLVGKDNTSVFLVTREGADVRVRSHTLSTPELVGLVDPYLRAIRQRSNEERDRGRSLYAMLLAPFERELRGRTSLHIVPDGILWQVPFHALRDARGTLVIDHWDVAYAPSLTTLALSGRRKRPIDARAGLVAFGNPHIPGETATRARARFRDFPLAPLPDANHEVRTIAGMYRNAAVFTDATATEEEIKRRVASCDVLHVATHGMVDDSEPMHSALVFTPSRHEDGLLETRELLHLDIGAGLAVLSACDTARGAQTPGEGVVSLSWALQVAGCPTTVVSLWKAESRAASALMIEFHRSLLSGTSIPEALRTAQRSLRRNARFEHPFYWAPFIVIGAR